MRDVRRWVLPAALFACGACGGGGGTAPADGGAGTGDPGTVHTFRKIILSSEFTSEGATYGDFNRDGARDVVAGPYWYEGPAFSSRHRIYPPVVFDPKAYSDNFFAFVRDFDGDGWDDVLIVGFPGQTAAWLRNPAQPGGTDVDWVRHVVVNAVDIESPAFVDLTGDGVPELVFGNGGRLGWAGPAPGDPALPWTFHPLSPSGNFVTFTHGLGVGDVDGDGRADVLEATGWWRQPASLAGDPVWERRLQAFGLGGAQMLTQDVDGDGDADVITSLAAHGSGLAWFQQGASASFTERVIVPLQEGGGLALHEPHAVAVSDLDQDGLPDIVTGERFWAHVPGGEPDFAAPARLYWFQLVRDAAGPRYFPRLVDEGSGVGTQVVVGDVTGDGLSDIVVGNKKGAFLFVHELPATP